MRWLYLYSVCF